MLVPSTIFKLRTAASTERGESLFETGNDWIAATRVQVSVRSLSARVFSGYRRNRSRDQLPRSLYKRMMPPPNPGQALSSRRMR